MKPIRTRLERLEQERRAGLVCDDCLRAGLSRWAWCEHRMPPPFDRFVPRCLERRHQEGQTDAGT